MYLLVTSYPSVWDNLLSYLALKRHVFFRHLVSASCVPSGHAVQAVSPEVLVISPAEGPQGPWGTPGVVRRAAEIMVLGTPRSIWGLPSMGIPPQLDGFYSGKSQQDGYELGVPPFQDTSIQIFWENHDRWYPVGLDPHLQAKKWHHLLSDTELNHGRKCCKVCV